VKDGYHSMKIIDTVPFKGQRGNRCWEVVFGLVG